MRLRSLIVPPYSGVSCAHRRFRRRRFVLAIAAALVGATPGLVGLPASATGGSSKIFAGPVARAHCGPGSRPEPGLQGEVPVSARKSGASTAGYWCNLKLVGHYLGEGASWQDTWYRHCGYYDTKFWGPAAVSQEKHPGVQVIDASNPAHPRWTADLTSLAMLDPWESLSVNPRRGLLAGVAVDRYNSGVGGMSGGGFFDVYSVKRDCAHPKLMASTIANGLGHEGNWAPDGRTYYATSIAPGTLTAIDVSDPSNPTRLWSQPIDPAIHGFSVSNDGTKLYLATIADAATGQDGVTVLDVSDIQHRVFPPVVRTVGKVTWTDGSTAQMTIPFTEHGHAYLIATDEGSDGGVRIIDLGGQGGSAPRVISKLKTDIQMPQNSARAANSAAYGRGNGNEGTFGYNAHYCGVPQRNDPGIVACSEFESGVRVFDIRNPYRPREIAYFNPGGNRIKPVVGSHRSGGESGYTSARVRVIAKTGELWFTDQDKGFYIVKFVNGVWPFRDSPLPPASGPNTDGMD
jgi:hypothetical protein